MQVSGFYSLVQKVSSMKKNKYKKYRQNNLSPSVLFGICFLVLVCFLTLFYGVNKTAICAYIIMSCAAYYAYAVDKKASLNDKWRTPESTLHALSLFGGWPGALYAQNRLRHKSRKQPFKTILWLTVGLNLLLFWVVYF